MNDESKPYKDARPWVDGWGRRYAEQQEADRSGSMIDYRTLRKYEPLKFNLETEDASYNPVSVDLASRVETRIRSEWPGSTVIRDHAVFVVPSEVRSDGVTDALIKLMARIIREEQERTGSSS